MLALNKNTVGSHNTANGYGALQNNTMGNNNTAMGEGALIFNTTGVGNTANGYQALFSNTTVSGVPGSFNTASGYQALYHNTTGGNNTAMGPVALFNNTQGDNNTAVGNNALSDNQTGSGNVAVGTNAGLNVTGSGNTILGLNAGQGIGAASGVICIGATGANVDATTWMTGIYGRTTVSGTTLPVIVSNQGQLGTAASSARFKREIKSMDKASEAILALKPVTFKYKSDDTDTPQFGLVAEEVAEVNPDLIVRDKNGEIYSVRYDAVNAMLLNEFLKEHRKVQELKATAAKQEAAIGQQREDFEAAVAEQKKEIQALIAATKEQAEQIQKVTARLEVTEPRSRTVLNDLQNDRR